MLKKLFQKFDEATFKGVDQIKGTPQYNQVANSIEGLPEEGQKIVNQGLTYALSFLPVFVLAILFLLNASIRSNIAEKETLIKNISEFNGLRAKSSKIGNNLVGQTPLNGEGSLKGKLNSIARSYSLNSNALQVKEFSNDRFGELIQTQATVSFREMSTPKFIGLLDSFLVQEKARLVDIKLTKKNDTLDGSFSFVHYGRQGANP